MPLSTIVKKLVRHGPEPLPDHAWRDFFGQDAPEFLDWQVVLANWHERALSPAERVIVSQIERRRTELRGSRKSIVYQDFGSGAPDEERTAEQMREGVASKRRVADLAKASVPAEWGLLLFRAIRRFRPTRMIELGSALGISGAYQSAAARLNRSGHLYTLEGCMQMARIARTTLNTVGPEWSDVLHGRFQDNLSLVLEKMERVDFAFVDGHHDELATYDYWGEISERLTERSVVVFDDIDWSAGMARAWHRIRNDDVVACSIDLGKFGCCLCCDKSFSAPMQFDLPYPPPAPEKRVVPT